MASPMVKWQTEKEAMFPFAPSCRKTFSFLFGRDTDRGCLQSWNGEGFPRPLLDLRAESFAKVMDKAFGRSLSPPFDPYASGINFLIASYMIPYVGLTGYIGTNQRLKGSASKQVKFLSL